MNTTLHVGLHEQSLKLNYRKETNFIFKIAETSTRSPKQATREDSREPTANKPRKPNQNLLHYLAVFSTGSRHLVILITHLSSAQVPI